MLSCTIHRDLARCDAHRVTAARCHLHLILGTTGDSVTETGWRFFVWTLASEFAKSLLVTQRLTSPVNVEFEKGSEPRWRFWFLCRAFELRWEVKAGERDSWLWRVCVSSDWPVVFLSRFFLMYLINKDETEHTGQVQYDHLSLRSLPPIKRINYPPVNVRDTVGVCASKYLITLTYFVVVG